MVVFSHFLESGRTSSSNFPALENSCLGNALERISCCRHLWSPRQVSTASAIYFQNLLNSFSEWISRVDLCQHCRRSMHFSYQTYFIEKSVCSIVDNAEVNCGGRWLLHIDNSLLWYVRCNAYWLCVLIDCEALTSFSRSFPFCRRTSKCKSSN